MVGHVLTRQLRERLGENSTSSWINVQLSYDLIYEAVLEFVDRTACLQKSGNITTGANLSSYTLPYDFQRLYMRDTNGDYFIRYVDSNNSVNNIIFDDYTNIILNNNTDNNSVAVPSTFCILPSSAANQVSNNTTAAGTIDSNTSLSTMTDANGSFVSTVSVGDDVFDTLNSYSGKVVTVSSNTALSTALYASNGTAVGWANATTYMIQPQMRFSLVVDPPTETANETITIYYVYKPDIVYSPYKAYPIHYQYLSPIVDYAAWLYKYRDMEPNFGDKWYIAFDTITKQLKNRYDTSVRKKGWTVNFKRPA